MTGRDRLSPRAILIVAFLGFVLYAFPGYMSSDSFVQLTEARSLVFTDPHPPIMAAQWMLLDALVAGPVLMLLVQGALFLLGMHRLLRHVLADRAAAIAAGVLLWFPPVLAPMGVIWKDSQMAGFLVAGTAALLAESRRTRVAGLALIGLACGVRYNGFAAGVPIIGLLFVWNPGLPWVKRYALSGAVAIATVVSAFAVNRLLTVEHGEMSATSGTAVADVIGVLYDARDYRDEELRTLFAGAPIRITTGIQAYVRDHYTPRNSYWATHGDTRLFDPPATADEERALTRAWRTLVAANKAAYVHHRLRQYRELLGLSRNPLWAPVYGEFVERADHPPLIEHDAAPSRIQRTLHDAFSWLANETPLFRPWIYAILALVLLVGFCRDRITFALLGSGLLYELSFLPAAGTPDYRYSHWLITTVVLAIVLIVVRRSRRATA